MAGFGIGRSLSQTVRENEPNVKPQLKQGEDRNLSRDTLDRLGETSEALDALFVVLKTKGVDVDGLQEPSSILAVAIEFLAGDPGPERASRPTGRHRRFAVAASRGRYGRRAVEAGGTYAVSRPFVEFSPARKRSI